MCGCLCIYAHSYKCASGYAPCVCSLTICARRYICAWLAVRVGLGGPPSRTACWEILVGVELMLWARLINCAAAGEVVRLIYNEKMNRIIRLHTSFTLLISMSLHQFPLNNTSNIQDPEYVHIFTTECYQKHFNLFKSKKRSSTAHRASSVAPSFCKASKINLVP